MQPGRLPVTAVVLAAGLSRRMGRFKLTLPWRRTTVIGQVLATLAEADLAEVVVVTGHRAEEVAAAAASGVDGMPRLRFVQNPGYESGEMLSSIQVGLSLLDAQVTAALLCLGDQPQMEACTVKAVLAAGEGSNWQSIVIPSYRMRAGHPILLPREVWPAVLVTRESLRAVLKQHREGTHYVTVDSPSILADLDTPEDYGKSGQGL